jgi:hypothetical protein
MIKIRSCRKNGSLRYRGRWIRKQAIELPDCEAKEPREN